MVKNPSAMQETWVRSIPGSGRSSGEVNGYPLQYGMNSFCLKENCSNTISPVWYVPEKTPLKDVSNCILGIIYASSVSLRNVG